MILPLNRIPIWPAALASFMAGHPLAELNHGRVPPAPCVRSSQLALSTAAPPCNPCPWWCIHRPAEPPSECRRSAMEASAIPYISISFSSSSRCHHNTTAASATSNQRNSPARPRQHPLVAGSSFPFSSSSPARTATAAASSASRPLPSPSLLRSRTSAAAPNFPPCRLQPLQLQNHCRPNHSPSTATQSIGRIPSIGRELLPHGYMLPLSLYMFYFLCKCECINSYVFGCVWETSYSEPFFGSPWIAVDHRKWARTHPRPSRRDALYPTTSSATPDASARASVGAPQIGSRLVLYLFV